MPTLKTPFGRLDGRYMKSGRCATQVVAASDSLAKSRYQADYVCDGTADDVEIQAAIDAVAAVGGGKVLLAEGQYNIEGDIYLKSNVDIEGSGPYTELYIKAPVKVFYFNYGDSSVSTTLTVALNIDDTTITVASTEGFSAGDEINIYKWAGDFYTIQSVDSSTQITLTAESDIELPTGAAVTKYSNSQGKNIRIANIKFYVPSDGLGGGEIAYAVAPYHIKNFTLENCQFINDSSGTLRVMWAKSNKYLFMNKNYFENCDLTSWGKLLSVVSDNIAVSCTGESLAGDCQSTVVSDNVLVRSKKLLWSNVAHYVVVANNILLESDAIAYIVSGHDSVIVGNKSIGSKSRGIYTETALTYNILIADNSILNPTTFGIASYKAPYTIIQDNFIAGSGTQGILIGYDGTPNAGTENIIVKNNTIKDATAYGIYEDNLSGNNLIEGNYIENCGSGAIRPGSLGTTGIRRNVGYATEKSGTATISSGNTYTDVSHGLDIKPATSSISVVPTNNLGDATKYYISDVGASTFRINVNVDPGVTTATFVWQIGSY